MKLVITGHRPDKTGGYELWTLKMMVEYAKDQMRKLSPTVVINGGALGWDMACAIATIQLRDTDKLPIELWMFVPFAGQSSQWKNEKLIEHYDRVISKADRVLNIHEVPPADKAQAVGWLQERNERMVDAGEKVLALWNGTKGGTNNCLIYANKMGLPITNAWPGWLSIMKAFPSRKA